MRSAHDFSFDPQVEDLVFSVMDGDRRFGIRYTRKGRTSPLMEGDSETQGILKHCGNA